MKKALLSLATLTALAAASAQATPIRLDGSETNLQQIVNNLAVDGSSSVNVETDQYGFDGAWDMLSPTGATSMIVVEIAGYAGQNRFGLYDVNDSLNRVQLFSGADGAGAGTQFAIDADGHVYRGWSDTGMTFTSELFGFYLETPNGVWYSQAGLNADGDDHMVAYQGVGDLINRPYSGTVWGPETFLLGWEDLASSGWDQDYNDLVVLVNGVKGVKVPEPTTLGLLGFSLAGLGLVGRRRRKQ